MFLWKQGRRCLICWQISNRKEPNTSVFNDYPRARMGSKSIAHKAFGLIIANFARFSKRALFATSGL